jgi:hypothetical protein
MRRFIAGLCCVVVGLQVLVGVPAAVCLAFLVYLGGDVLGPISFEVRATSNAQPTQPSAPVDQPREASAQDDAILEARGERGSLLAGTVLGESLTPADEQREFVAAFRQIAAEVPGPALAPANPLPSRPTAEQAYVAPKGISQRAEADRLAIDHLYAMADMDEQTGVYDRADQWRGLARAIRRDSQPEANADSTACAECLWFMESP